MIKITATNLNELKRKMHGRINEDIYITYSLKREIDTMPMELYKELIEELKARKISLICERISLGS